jgi:FKBP-type peptidyl-prolyl cis-trans isomerase FkpA
MRISSFMIAAVAAAFFTSCKETPYEGYDQTETGLYYQFYNQNEGGRKPVEGEFASVLLTYRTDSDSILFDSKKYMQNPDGTVDFSVMKPSFKGSFEEALVMMAEGDSASFKVSADSIFMKNMGARELPEFIKPGSMLTFEVKLVKIKSKEDMEKQLKAQQEREMEEYKKLVEERKTAEGEEITEYLTKNKITLKPTESGLYYIEQKKGTGARVKVGDQVTVDYALYALDGTKIEASTATFALEPGKMIDGFIEGLAKMNVGGKATLLLPSAIAYGEMGNQAIPPYTPLLFEVEVKEIKPGTPGNKK